MRISTIAHAIARHADRALLASLLDTYLDGRECYALADRVVDSARAASPSFAFDTRHVADWCMLDAAIMASEIAAEA